MRRGPGSYLLQREIALTAVFLPLGPGQWVAGTQWWWSAQRHQQSRQHRQDTHPRRFVLPVSWVTRWAMAWRELMKSSCVSLEPQVGRKARKGKKEHVRKQHEVQKTGCYWKIFEKLAQVVIDLFALHLNLLWIITIPFLVRCFAKSDSYILKQIIEKGSIPFLYLFLRTDPCS